MTTMAAIIAAVRPGETLPGITQARMKIAMTAQGIELTNGQGATLKLTGPEVSVNNGALEGT